MVPLVGREQDNPEAMAAVERIEPLFQPEIGGGNKRGLRPPGCATAANTLLSNSQAAGQVSSFPRANTPSALSQPSPIITAVTLKEDNHDGSTLPP